jgi:hypothetical protein
VGARLGRKSRHATTTGAALLAARVILPALAVALLGSGCEQLIISNVNQVSDASARGEVSARALAVIVTPAFWEALSARSAALRTDIWDRWEWSGGAASLTLGDGAEVSVGPLEATFDIQGVGLVVPPGGGALRVTLSYRAPLLPARLLYRDAAGGTQLCKLDLNLRQRQVVLDLVPGVGPQGQPIWSAGASNGLEGDERITYQPTEACSLDLDAFDWVALSAQVTGALSAHIQAQLVPSLREGLVAALGLPAGSIALSRPPSGFFAQQPMTLTSTVSANGPWNGAAFDVTAAGWLRVAFDVGLPMDEPDALSCGAPLPPLALPPTAPLLALDQSATTPRGGEPYHVLWRIDHGMLARFFGALLSAGGLCADLSPDTNQLSAFGLLAAPVLGLSDAVRLRVQPLAPLSLSVIGPKTLRLSATLRLELFGQHRETTLRWASLAVALEADLTPQPHDVVGMRFDLDALSVDVLSADVSALQALNPSAVNLQRLAEVTLRFLIQEHLRWPLVRALGQRLEVVELTATEQDLHIYLRLLTP